MVASIEYVLSVTKCYWYDTIEAKICMFPLYVIDKARTFDKWYWFNVFQLCKTKPLQFGHCRQYNNTFSYYSILLIDIIAKFVIK